MPKMKTKRAAAKRFKITGTGRVRRPKAGKQHRMMRGDKSPARLRRLRKNAMVAPCDEKEIKRLMPYAPYKK
ncbi:MAG TPA: 50S ribosomal protein L35 [Polyangiaceae bacterium LLY-WYZ-15_(1-7)]|nr:50S ribosomal protein L35 [Myxococcales bacterium]MAT25738.1 50S ribosomal protein L35 [Sandaracinus sp.]HJK92390.1 50S ribosomal protein L35 [Polyangiaceae bacterium LLY-WYZ-15_(1-7)]MBJ71661.1 50S ribosomal protein L35 [Sandaracinus sp.]HJK99811.1 50S ribosomal protein L35 [Polyangiaceae bacterium LLY-WYZ-15_(1-7)]